MFQDSIEILSFAVGYDHYLMTKGASILGVLGEILVNSDCVFKCQLLGFFYLLIKEEEVEDYFSFSFFCFKFEAKLDYF